MSGVPVCEPPCEDWPLCRHREPAVQVWRDRHGDLWALRADGLLHAYETRPFPREYVERKWGPLVEVTGPGAGG